MKYLAGDVAEKLKAAVCITAANIPQLKKAWETGQTDDLSLKTLLLSGSGLALWVIYGFFQQEPSIVLANGVSLLLFKCYSVLEADSTMRWFLTSSRVRFWHKADIHAEAEHVCF